MSTTYPIDITIDRLQEFLDVSTILMHRELGRGCDFSVPGDTAIAAMLEMALEGQTADDLVAFLRASDEWKAKHPAPPKPGERSVRSGLVLRGPGKSWVDAGGRFYPFGTSGFTAINLTAFDEARAIRQLDYIQRKGGQDVRVFSSVDFHGPTSVDPRAGWYIAAAVRLLELCRERRLRWNLTLFAGADSWFRSVADYERHVATVALLFDAPNEERRELIRSVEAVNEAETDGVDLTTLAAIVRAIRRYLPWVALVGASSEIPGAAADRSAVQQAEATYGWGATALIAQMPRTGADDGWAEVCAPWEYRDAPVPVDHNEPVGTSSSSHWETDPLRLACLRLVGILCGVDAFCLHTGAGIEFVAHQGDGGIHPAVAANIDEEPNIDAVFDACAAVEDLVPPDNGTGEGDLYIDMRGSAAPLACSTWPAGAYRGFLKLSPDAKQFWAVLPGVRGAVTLTARRPCTVRVHEFGAGAGAVSALQAGETVTYTPAGLRDDKGAGALVLWGAFTDDAPAMQPPATQDEWHALFRAALARRGMDENSRATPPLLRELEPDLTQFGGSIEHTTSGDVRGRWYVPKPGHGPYDCAIDIVRTDEQGNWLTWGWVPRYHD